MMVSLGVASATPNRRLRRWNLHPFPRAEDAKRVYVPEIEAGLFKTGGGGFLNSVTSASCRYPLVFLFFNLLLG